MAVAQIDGRLQRWLGQVVTIAAGRGQTIDVEVGLR